MAEKDKIQHKKDQVLGKDQKNKSPRLIPAMVIVAVLTAAAAGAWLTLSGDGKENAPSSGLKIDADRVTIEAAQFSDGKARHFSFKAPNGTTIRFFVLKSSDGVIRAAFDACDVCWPANKGYSQDGDVMVCNNCGRRFASIKVNEVRGGCNPAPLNRIVKDGKVLLKAADILEGGRFFNFNRNRS